MRRVLIISIITLSVLIPLMAHAGASKTFKGKEYLVLKATYDEAVGKDVWYFYFDPETYAMEIYQFFRMDDDGNQKIFIDI